MSAHVLFCHIAYCLSSCGPSKELALLILQFVKSLFTINGDTRFSDDMGFECLVIFSNLGPAHPRHSNT